MQLQPVQGLIQVKRPENIEYMYVGPVKAVCSDVQKLPINSPDELIHGIAHNIYTCDYVVSRAIHNLSLVRLYTHLFDR